MSPLIGMSRRRGPAIVPANPLVFESNWTNGTGSGATAILDGSTWSRGAQPNHEIVTAASCGFDAVVPAYTGNVYRCQYRGSDGGGQIQQDTAVSESTSHYGRFFVRNNATGRNDHGVVYNGIRSGLTPNVNTFQINNFRRISEGASQWRIAVGHLFPYPYGVMYSPLLDNTTWYRYEWHIEYATATTMRIWPRIYEGNSSTLLYDADDFDNAPEGGSVTTLSGYLDVGGVNRFSSLGILNGDETGANAVAARRFCIGDEGPNQTPPAGTEYHYYAAVAISETTWVGAY